MLNSYRSEEYVDAINAENQVIGIVPRSESYAKKIPHRIVHVMLIDQDRVYLVRRSRAVRYLPGFHCTSAGGHVMAGESAETAALRELREEIGLQGPITLLAEYWFEHEFSVHTSVFMREFDPACDQLQLNPDEVMDGAFYSQAECAALDSAQFHPQLLPCLKKVFEFLDGEKK